MRSETVPPTLLIGRKACIRQEIRRLVLYTAAPLETAELLQVGLITLAHGAWAYGATCGQGEPGEAGFVRDCRERMRAALVDEVRQMSHLPRLSRRRWLMLKLARHDWRQRLCAVGLQREPSAEELAVATGLSVLEIESLHQMAGIGPRDPAQASHQLMSLRFLRPPNDAQRRQARAETEMVLRLLARCLSACPPQGLQLLRTHFGVTLAPPDGRFWAARCSAWSWDGWTWGPGSWDEWRSRAQDLWRRSGPATHPGHPMAADEALWPSRLSSLLQAPVAAAGAAA